MVPLMILTDLTTYHRKNLKEQDALSIARSCQKHLSKLRSMGYATGAVVDDDRSIVTVTTPQGRRFEVAVREISCDEEIEQGMIFPAPTNRPARALAEIEAARLPPVSAADVAPEPRKPLLTGKAARIFTQREQPDDPKIDGEYVYRNYFVSFDGRTWEDLTPEERLDCDDRARRLVAASGGFN